MPTENRSSNTEMVSVPRVPTREMLNGVCMHPDLARSLWSALLKNAPQPAEQHQGEPVALPERKGTHLRYDTLMPTFSKGWNACLDEIAKLGPLYTNADPNVRWKAVADEQMLVITGLRQHKTDYMEAAEETRKALRAQLAERDALLRDIDAWMDREDRTPGFEIEKRMAEVFRPASAEPSAPVDATHYYPEAESGRQWRKKVGGLWCEFCGGKWLPIDVQDMSHGYVAIEPSAPVERDERADFEACIRREWPMAPISRKRDLLPKEDPCYGDYCDEPLQRAWVGWQMRAAMERKPF